MSLFDDPDDEIDDVNDPRDLKYVERLRSAIVNTTHRVCGWSRLAWGNEFRKLRTSFKDEADKRIDEVLSWYVRNIGKPMVPEAYCANSFRRKFDRIEAAMKRDQRDNPPPTTDPIALRISERLLMKAWPKGSDKDVPSVVAVSLRNVEEFAHKLATYERQSVGNSVGSLFAKRIQADIGTPSSFTESWMNWVHDRVKNWEAWDGKLARWAFRPDHDQFHKMGAGWAAKYGDVRLWAKLMEALK